MGWSLDDAELLSGVDWDSIDWDVILNSDRDMLDIDNIMAMGN